MFWYGSFDIEESKNLSLLLDTGSGDFAVNPDLYKPSSDSKNLNHTGQLEYTTLQKDGCGMAKLKYSAYSDSVSMVNLISENQTFASIGKLNGTFTQFPHEGIGGMVGESTFGRVPWFKNLCSQG